MQCPFLVSEGFSNHDASKQALVLTLVDLCLISDALKWLLLSYAIRPIRCIACISSMCTSDDEWSTQRL